MSADTLNYRPPRDAIPIAWKIPWRRIVVVFAALVLAAIAAEVVSIMVTGWGFVGPTGASIRLDTGDVQFNYFGIPGRTRLMPEPARTAVMSLAANSSVLKNEWDSVPYSSAHGGDAYYVVSYVRATAWAKVDRRIATALLEDVASVIKGPHPATGGVPSFHYLLDHTEPTGQSGGSKWRVLPGWEDDQHIIDYLKSKGINIPSTRPGVGRLRDAAEPPDRLP